MPANLEKPFAESCCDGGAVVSLDSAQPCGCDPMAGWVCEQHTQRPVKEWQKAEVGVMRQFESGATRDGDDAKFDYEGFLSPAVLTRFGAYMHEHRKQSDGGLRASDNWQKGIPVDAYMKSLLRHVIELWTMHRGDGIAERKAAEDTLCAILFNAQGYLFEALKSR